MADHSELQTTTGYAALLAMLHERMTDLAKALDGVGTNLPVGTVRWDGGAKKWKKWNGSAWVDLADVFDIKNTAANTNCTAVMGQTNVQSALEALAGTIPSGTRMLFQQSTAPTGWTKVTDHDDKALRVVSGTASYGGSVAFSSAMSARTVSSAYAGGSVGWSALSPSQGPHHVHQQMSSNINGVVLEQWFGAAMGVDAFQVNASVQVTKQGSYPINTGSSGAWDGHSHSFTPTAHSHTLDMSIKYVDVIIASKN